MKAEDLRHQALALSESERVGLAADLLASLDEAADDDVDSVRRAWHAPVERRALPALAGESESEPRETVRQRIADEFAG